MEELQHCEILKTKINVTNMSDTIKYICSHLDELRGKYICVSNVHTTVMSYENEEYRKIQNGAAMALPDGAPLSSYSRRKGYKDAQRVTGPDLMLELFKIFLWSHRRDTDGNASGIGTRLSRNRNSRNVCATVSGDYTGRG